MHRIFFLSFSYFPTFYVYLITKMMATAIHASNMVISKQQRHLRDRFWNLFASVK